MERRDVKFFTDRPCDTYCEHGGECVLEQGHEGLHDSRYCQWSDADALSKEEADAVFFAKAEENFIGGESFARLLVNMSDILKGTTK